MESRQVSSIYEATSAFRLLTRVTLWGYAIQIVKKKFQFGRVRPAGAMVNAFAYGAKDSRFESWVGRKFLGVLTSKMHFTLLEFGYYEVIGPKHRILRVSCQVQPALKFWTFQWGWLSQVRISD